MDAIKNFLGLITRLPLIYFGGLNLLTIFWFGFSLDVTKFILFFVLSVILLFIGFVPKRKLDNERLMLLYKISLVIGIIISLIMLYVTFGGIYMEQRDGYEHAIILISCIIQIVDKNFLKGKAVTS